MKKNVASRLIFTCLYALTLEFFSHAKTEYKSGPLYFCTAASREFHPQLLNLIGSIHKTNFDDLGEIIVFDLGLDAGQLKMLKKIKKLVVADIKKTNPDMLKRFPIMYGRTVPGWYAWKCVAIKQALERYPYVLWVDAGTTILKPLKDLFRYIRKNGYFLCTVGGDLLNNVPCHNVHMGTTKYIIDKFNLYAPENRWILEAECVMGGVQGVSRAAANKFILPMYELSKDLRNFQDDGTALGGKGFGRHDQPLLSILAYSKGLTVFRQDYKQNVPMMLSIDGKEVPFYITYEGKYVNNNTHIYSSRGDMPLLRYYFNRIHKK